MRNGFLLKTLILVIALAAVAAVMVAVIRGGFGAAGREAAQSQTFFEQFVIAGGPIVWFVLLPMSLVMVYLALEYSFTIRRKKLLPEAAGAGIVEKIQSAGGGQLELEIADKDDFVSVAVAKAITRGRGDWLRMRNLTFESLEEQTLRLMRKIEWLNLIGNVSPMVGLFGTVFGMIKLFNAIVTAGGQPQPAQLAGGISVALVTTFWGLLIAIPALGAYGVFRNRIEALVSDAVGQAEGALAEIRLCLLKKQKAAGQPKPKQSLIKPGIQDIGGRTGPTVRQSQPLR